ncbi:MAG: hypothetical protein AAFR59_07105, partial [Bacteroidota bacterium]
MQRIIVYMFSMIMCFGFLVEARAQYSFTANLSVSYENGASVKQKPIYLFFFNADTSQALYLVDSLDRIHGRIDTERIKNHP